MDIRLALMCGTDIPIPECQLIAHQPVIKELAMIGEEDFLIGSQCLNISKNLITQDETLLENSNNFQIFMTIMTQKETADKKFAVQQLFQLIFPQYKVSFTPRSLMFMTEGEQPKTIDDTNFEYLQEIIRKIFCLNSNFQNQANFNPADKKAKEIADKIMRGRKRVAEQKGENQGSFLAQYISILTVGLQSMSLDDCMNLTIFQLYDLIERYQLYMNWDIDLRVRLTGSKPDESPDNWMKNIHTN